MPGYGPPGAASNAPKTLSDRAADAFRKGNDREAFQFIYAAALADDEAAERLPDEFRWIGYLKKPAMGVRWGLGVSYNPPKGYTGHPSPVGYEPPASATNNTPGGAPGTGGPPGSPNGGQQKPRRVFGQRDRSQQNQPGGYGGAPGQPNQPGHDKPAPSHPPADAAGFLAYYTGEVGESVLEALTKRITDGSYGPVLQHAMENFESSPASANNGGYPGYPGAGPPPGMMPPGSPPGMQGGPNNNAAKPEKFKTGSIIPGVVMLGEGSETELLKTAEEQGVDFIILFDVSVRKSNKDATSITKFRVVSVDKAKLPAAATVAEGQRPREIFVSNAINSHRVETAREKNETDPLAEAIEGFVAAIDTEVKLVPLSEKVNAEEVALRRATDLSGQQENQLANMAEIRQYEVAKLISSNDATELFTKILGSKDKAEKLRHGKTEADRASVLKLPKT